MNTLVRIKGGTIMAIRPVRLVVACSVMLALFGSLLATETMARPKSCVAFKPSTPPDGAPDVEEALEAPVMRVTDAATERDPLTIEYDQGPGQVFPLHQSDPIIPENSYFNFQVVSSKGRVGLFVRSEWFELSPSDIDSYLYDRWGAMVAWSEAFNNVLLDTVWGEVFYPLNGGPGFEFIEGLPVRRCAGFTLQNVSSSTLGERVTLKVWLGKAGCPRPEAYACGW